jgi:hypothetical protein
LGIRADQVTDEQRADITAWVEERLEQMIGHSPTQADRERLAGMLAIPAGEDRTIADRWSCRELLQAAAMARADWEQKGGRWGWAWIESKVRRLAECKPVRLWNDRIRAMVEEHRQDPKKAVLLRRLDYWEYQAEKAAGLYPAESFDEDAWTRDAGQAQEQAADPPQPQEPQEQAQAQDGGENWGEDW